MVKPACDRFVGQVAGRDDMGYVRAVFSRNAAAFGQMHFNKTAVPPAEFAERIERLDDARPSGPAAARTGGQRHNRQPTF